VRAVVVGASVAGVAAAVALRDEGFGGEVLLVGEEPHVPYDRPPLSKQLLAGAIAPGDCVLPAAGRLAERAITHLPGCAAAALDLAAGEVVLEDGRREAFDGLVVASGSRARRLALAVPAEGVHVLRTLDDAIAVRAAIAAAGDVVVIGAGFIGLEVASSARMLGRSVTVLEVAPRPMARLVGDETAGWFTELHEANGVAVRCGVTVEGFEEEGGRVTGVRLAGAAAIPADVVVVGVGAAPNDGWLVGSGLRVADGVVCDATLRAAPGVYAAGDVARWQHPTFGSIRVEHWTTAGHHARTAAANLAADLAGAEGDRQVAGEIPYFWSDQFDCRIQMAGWVAGHEQVSVAQDGRRRLARFGRGGQLVAALAWNWPAELARQRRAIAAGAAWGPA
jgi:NADPH-dependent 2,4-dienoyl-CoA reductase/sulfur reductase-like enzyme